MSLMEENWSEQTVKNALRANASKSGHCIVQDGVKCLNPWDCQSKRQFDVSGVYPTLQAMGDGGGRADGVCYSLSGKQQSLATTENKANTLGANDYKEPQSVCYPETARTLAARHDSSPCVDRGQNVVSIDCRNMVENEEISGTIQAKSNGGYSLNYQNPVCYRNGGYGGMAEGCGTLRANGGDAGPGSENIVVEKHE